MKILDDYVKPNNKKNCEVVLNRIIKENIENIKKKIENEGKSGELSVNIKKVNEIEENDIIESIGIYYDYAGAAPITDIIKDAINDYKEFKKIIKKENEGGYKPPKKVSKKIKKKKKKRRTKPIKNKKKKKRRTKKIKKKKKKHKTRNHYKKTDKKKNNNKSNTKIGGNKNKNRNRKKKQFFEMSIAELQQHVKQLSNK